MTRTQQQLLLESFRDDTHVFRPTTVTAAAYGWFNGTVVPALERLAAEGYLRIAERVPNRFFSAGGRYAAYACELTAVGRAAQVRLRQHGRELVA